MDERLIARFAVGITMLPLLVAAVVLAARGGDYLPVSDHALIELRIRDIGHHPVLTGLYSRNEWSHPGPLFFYLVAPLYWLSGGTSIAVNIGALLINGASIAGMAIVARRRGGLPLMLIVLAACALVVRTLGVDFVSDPWNTYVTVLPFALLIFLTWAMTCGEAWALPVGALTASFLAQAHIGFVLLALPLLAVGAVWLAVVRRREVVRPAAATAAILGLVWLPVLVDLVTGTTGNLSTAYRWLAEAEDGIHTPIQGWRVASAQLAVPPEWLVSHREPFWPTGEPVDLYRTRVPAGVALLGAAAWSFRRRRDGDGARLLVVYGGAFALAVVAVWRTVGLAFDYRLRWTWILGVVAAVVVAWAASAWQRRIVGVLALAALVGASSVNTVVAARGETPRSADSAVLAALLPGLLAAVGDDPRPVVVSNSGAANASWYTRSLVLQLERRGIDASMPLDERAVVGAHRVTDDLVAGRTFLVAMDDQIANHEADPSLTRVASWSSVTDAQLRSHRRLEARLDLAVARGDMEPVERALILYERGIQVLDDAVAWAVAVYVEDVPRR